MIKPLQINFCPLSHCARMHTHTHTHAHAHTHGARGKLGWYAVHASCMGSVYPRRILTVCVFDFPLTHSKNVFFPHLLWCGSVILQTPDCRLSHANTKDTLLFLTNIAPSSLLSLPIIAFNAVLLICMWNVSTREFVFPASVQFSPSVHAWVTAKQMEMQTECVALVFSKITLNMLISTRSDNRCSLLIGNKCCTLEIVTLPHSLNAVH